MPKPKRRPIRNPNQFRFPLRATRKRYLVITDATQTEKYYFSDLNQIAYDVVEVFSKNADIDNLLNIAVDRKTHGDYDEVCLIFDIDERLSSQKSKNTLMKYLAQAEENGINVYMSNQSFDIWVAAHCDKCLPIPTTAQDRKVAQKLITDQKMMIGAKLKRVRREFINEENIKRAIFESRRLRKAYAENGDIIKASGPVTDVDMLASKINLSAPKVEE